MTQLELNLMHGTGMTQTLCDFRPLTREEWEYAGFPKKYTNHLWCQKFYIGISNADGSITRCKCSCHDA